MKTLYIVRHAKSSWEDFSLADHDRPLAPSGIKKTGRIIKYLQQKGVKPDLMISSPAVRALETARLIARGTGYPADRIRVEESLYHASADTIMNELYGLPDNIDSVMIFGHNPAFTYFANNFLNPGIDNLPTTGVVSISFMTDRWEEADSAPHKVNFVIFPSMLKK